jgi:uncharacterized sulfatase
MTSACLLVDRAAFCADRPNVVLILADDQAYRDFGFMGNSSVHTPNIDALAARSARYPNGYVPMSVCRPSLATFLTGLYPHQHGIHFNHPPPGLSAMRKMSAEEYHRTRASTDYLIERVPTLPRILAQHGYACLQTGKHWEGSYKTAGFTAGMTLGLPTEKLGQVTGTRVQDNGEWVAHGNGDAGLVIGRETMQPIEEFIDRQAGRKPFFVWYAPFLPHAPFDAPQRFRDLLPKQFEQPELLPYYAEIARFDETVGQLLQMLAAHQLESTTLIVFMSDNGFRPDIAKPDSHNSRSKLSEYEDGLRTPLLISWAGQIRAADHPQLVHAIDVVPTVLSAAGLSHLQTEQMLGHDLIPSARGVAQLEERPMFGAIYPNDAQVLGQPARHARGRWVREGKFKLIVPGPGEQPLPPQLYNLERDPEEQENLIDQPASQKVRERLLILLDQWWPLETEVNSSTR